jgi:TRAP-type C4-dicarboxylate transport system substrate-binding protein
VETLPVFELPSDGLANLGRVILKVGTLVAPDSPWGQELSGLAADLRTASQGRIELKLYGGGSQGDEGDMLRKVRVGQLSGAALSGVGLHEGVPGLEALAAPMLVRTPEEMEAVLARFGPECEADAEARGFKVLAVADVGMVGLFSQQETASFDGWASQPILAWGDDPSALSIWRASGFKPMVVSSTDLVPSLQTGLVRAMAMPLPVAVSMGWTRQAPYMLDLAWGRMPAALIMSLEAWNRIPEADREPILERARLRAARLDAHVRELEAKAEDQLREQGHLVALGDAERAEWTRVAEEANALVRGRVASAAFFDAVVRDLALLRQGQP